METYKLIRSRRKTLSLSVTREGEVVVRAPYGVSAAYISAFVKKHEAWLGQRLARAKTAPVLSLADGERLVLFGSEYRLQTGRAHVEEGTVYLPQEGREEALVRLLRRFSREVMEHVTARIASRCGFSYRAVRISSARGRWGSCNRQGVIAYTFRIAFLPPELAEYVAVHELAHTVVFHHGPEFRAVVEQILPDRKRLEKALKESRAMELL